MRYVEKDRDWNIERETDIQLGIEKKIEREVDRLRKGKRERDKSVKIVR